MTDLDALAVELINSGDLDLIRETGMTTTEQSRLALCFRTWLYGVTDESIRIAKEEASDLLFRAAQRTVEIQQLAARQQSISTYA